MKARINGFEICYPEKSLTDVEQTLIDTVTTVLHSPVCFLFPPRATHYSKFLWPNSGGFVYFPSLPLCWLLPIGRCEA